MPSREELVRHHDEGDVVYVGAHPTGYVIRIEEPDPTWPHRYAELERQISTVLGDRLVAVQHIGSTSVPEMPAKPIIDIDVAVPDPLDEDAYVPALESLGLVHWLTEPDWHQHRLFKMLTEPRVHVHVFAPDCPEMVRHRMFRDWLAAPRTGRGTPRPSAPRWSSSTPPVTTTRHSVSGCATTPSSSRSCTRSTSACSGPPGWCDRQN